MPEVSFGIVSIRPKIELIEGDFFFESTPPGVPDIPLIGDDGLSGAADDAIQTILPLIGIAAKVPLTTPTGVDIAGCDLGINIANNAQRLNRTANGSYTFADIAAEVMDVEPDGFMAVYNAHVDAYAYAEYTAGIWHVSGSPEHTRLLHKHFTDLRRNLKGQMRGYNALLGCAWGIAFFESDLDAEAPENLVREGKWP